MTIKNNVHFILSKIESQIETCSSKEECRNILFQIDEIKNQISDQERVRVFIKAWPIAFKIGKVQIAENYISDSLDFLLKEKRIIKIESLLREIKVTGLCKNKISNIEEILKILKGESSYVVYADEDEWFETLLIHPRWWKNQKDFISYYLSIETDWELEDWKIIYEIALKRNLTEEILRALYSKSLSYKNGEFAKEFEKYFESKNIQTKKREEVNKKKKISKILDIDLNQIALDHFKGVESKDVENEKKILIELKLSSDLELKDKGKEMAIAFQTLGFYEACNYLCEKLIAFTEKVKERAEINFIMAQALFESGDYYSLINLIDRLLIEEPLTDEEVIAFKYLKAEAFFFQGKMKFAHAIYSEILRTKKNYRLIKDRLKVIEANK